MTTERLLKLSEVTAATGLARSTIYRRIGEGRFPHAYSLGERCVRWKQSEVDEWTRRLRPNGEASPAASPAAGAQP